MAALTTNGRKSIPGKDFAGPSRSFPIENATHARLAISGASHSEHVGNISKSEEENIQAKARAKLGEHKAAVAKMHPEHVHKLVQDAQAGKYGPDAQTAAKKATAPQPQIASTQDSPDAAPDAPAKNYGSIFSGGPSNAPASAPPSPIMRAAMFGSKGR